MDEPRPRLRQVADIVAALPTRLDARVISGDASTPWIGLSQDSRAVSQGNLYCCVRGEYFDGHTFARDAVQAGAVALLVEEKLANIPDTVPQIQVSSVRDAIGYVASDAYDSPSQDLVVIGITGTNGKTSTAHIIGGLLGGLGHSVAVFGTLSGERTTPEAIELQKRFALCRSEGVSHVVMEVSSHALALGRMHGTHMRVAVFTNLGHDHLDFHKTQEEYFRAKASLFRSEYADTAIVNRDDLYGLIILDTTDISSISFGQSDVSNVVVTARQTSFDWQGAHIHIPIGASFTVSNAMAAITAVKSLGYSPAQIGDACKNVLPVRGRFELVPGVDEFDVVVDYAHTPESLEEVLKTARAITTHSLIVVFGCGGDRDAAKRPLMGQVASELADSVIVTSDNPRSEDPKAIIDAVLAGVKNQPSKVKHIVDRRQAIAAAITAAQPGDVVVIAGKGHETTQEIAGTFTPFDDVQVTKQILAQMAGEEK